MVEVITLDDVYIALCSSKPTLYKAIVGLILSSSMSAATISKLTLKDFLIACGDYFNDDEEKSLNNLLKKDPWKIIPCWKLKSKNIITFNTPETTFYLFLYLKEKRRDDFDNLEYPLFKSGKNNFLTSSKISAYVTEFNTVLDLINDDYGNKFKSKNLIATFEDIYNKHLYIEINSKNNLIKLFNGKLAVNSKFYRYAVKNPYKIKDYYKMLIPFLTARLYNVGNEIKVNNTYLKDKKNISRIIQDYYDCELKDELNLDFAQEQLLCKFAEDSVKYDDSFLNDVDFLNKLFKKARVKLNLHNYNFERDFGFLRHYVEKNSNPEVYAKKLEKDSYRIGIYDLIEVSRDEFYKLLIVHIVKHNYYNAAMEKHRAERIIKEVACDLIDND